MNYDVSIKDGIAILGIFEKKSDAWVTSTNVARIFEKDHNHVLRDIRERILPNVSVEFGQSNFGQSYYRNAQNKRQPEYLLNRKSFSLVVMGFTGKKAMAFKESYIEAFEHMATVIDTRKLSKAGYREMTSAVSKYIGKDPRMFAKEADMINQIVLGMKAADFRAVHNIDDSGFTRDSVVQSKLNALDMAQRLNAQLITAKVTECVRESIIRTNFSGRNIA